MVNSQLQEQPTKLAPAPAILRSSVLLIIGWSLLILSTVLLTFHVLWMWRRIGNGAPLIAIGLVMDGLVGIALIVISLRARRRQ